MKKASPRRKKPAQQSDATAEFDALLQQAGGGRHYVLRLFVTGTTPRSAQALATIRSLCEEYLPGNYDLEVIDVYQQPSRAAGEQIIATPTLIRKWPMPAKRIVGDLSNREKILVGLDLREASGRLVASSIPTAEPA